MKLVSAQIRNYGNVVDSKEFEIENVTCLAGRNIDGKTTTLKALTKLNSADPLEGNFAVLRRGDSEQGVAKDRPENIVSTRWLLSPDEIKTMEKSLGRNCLNDEMVTIRKGYKNDLQWEIPINHNYRQDSPGGLSGNDYNVRFFHSGAISNLLHSLKPNLPGHHQEKLVMTDPCTDRSLAKIRGKEILEKRLPRFLYAAVYDIVVSDSSLTDLIKKKLTGTYSTGEKILIDWLTLAGTTPEQMLASGEDDAVVERMNQVAETFCRKISQYWPHYSQLAFDISVVPVASAQSGNAEADRQIRLRVKNRHTGRPESIDESRSGFLWFFSFLIRYTRAGSCPDSNLVLVLDEPGVTESLKAQASLLTYFSRELTPRQQLIYSTHLPTMVDPTMF